jgi:hypothetical protein
MKTGPNHPCGPDLNVRVLGCDEHGSTQIVQNTDGRNYAIVILDGVLIEDFTRAITLPQARTIAKECGKTLGW